MKLVRLNYAYIYIWYTFYKHRLYDLQGAATKYRLFLPLKFSCHVLSGRSVIWTEVL